MKAITNLLTFLYENWTAILVVIGLAVGIVQKTIRFFEKSDAERVEIVKEQIRQSMLKMITDAEEDYSTWAKAGEIKRSQVIKQVFDEYPILEKFVDQEQIVAWLDEQINDALKVLRKIVKEQEPSAEIGTE